MSRNALFALAFGASLGSLFCAPAGAQVIHEIPGNLFDRAAAAVSGFPDANQDGIPEILVLGEPNSSSHDFVYLYSGADASLLLSIHESFGMFGDEERSLTWIEDQDSDGVAEIVVGIGERSNNTGQVYVYSGADGQLLTTEHGDGPDDHFGISVGSGGDVNGDGAMDLIVGAPEGFSMYYTAPGYARVFSGSDGSELFTFHGDQPGDEFASAVAIAGDLNLDGFDDLLVGMPGDDNQHGIEAGAVNAYSGADGSLLWRKVGTGLRDQLGVAVSGAGDVDGDGHADFMAGARELIGGSPQYGYVRLYSGATGAAIHTFEGFFDREQLGEVVARAGDMNGDGCDDLAMGGLLESSNYPTSRIRVFSGADASLLFTYFTIPNNWSLEELHAAAAGDLNQDGFDDLIVGERYYNTHGLVRVFAGSGLLALTPPTPGLAGVQNTLQATTATPGVQVMFLASGPAGTTWLGCDLGEVLSPLRRPKTAGHATADGSGVATLVRTVPARFAGRTVRIHCLEDATCRSSNVVVHAFP